MSDLPINPWVLIGVGTTFGLSALSYHFYKVKEAELRKLKEVPIFKPDQHLLGLLKASPQQRLTYIAVEGLVQPDGESLSSDFVHRCVAVVQKISGVEHWEYWNSLTKTWDSQKSNWQQTNHAVPFSLVASSSITAPIGSEVRVKVQDPLEATGLDLERVHHRLRYAAEGGVSDAIHEELSGERVIAKEESEALLHVGATVTGFGQLVLEARGEEELMSLQAPQDGRPYVLVPVDYESYVARHQGIASMWRMLQVASVAMGTAVVVRTVCSFLEK